MGKLLLSLSLFSVILLAIGTAFFSQNPMFWVASGGVGYQVIRAALAVILLLQIYTKPPRSVLLRSLSGMLSLGIGIWAIESTFTNSMMMLDTMSLLSAAIAIGITALELPAQSSESLHKVPKKPLLQ